MANHDQAMIAIFDDILTLATPSSGLGRSQRRRQAELRRLHQLRRFPFTVANLDAWGTWLAAELVAAGHDLRKPPPELPT